MQNYFKILKYGNNYRHYVAYSFFFLLIYTFFSAFTLVSVIPFLDILFQPKTDLLMPPPLTSHWDIAGYKAHGYYALHHWIANEPNKLWILASYCIVLIFGILCKNIGKYFGDYFMAPYEQGIVKNMRMHIFQHLTTLGLPFYTQRKKGDIMGIMTSDVQVIQEAIIMTIMNLIREPLTMLTYLAAMLIISWKMTLFTLLVLPLTGLILSIISKKLKQRARLGQEAFGRLTSIIDEFIAAIRIVKSYQKEGYEAQKYHHENEEYARQQIAFRRRMELASPVTELMSILIVCLILLYGGNLILSQNPSLKPNEFIGFIALFSQFLLPIKNISTGVSKISKANASFVRIETLLDIVPQIQDKPNAIELMDFQAEIRFENVSFSYQTEPVLKNVSFTLRKGEQLAIVGPSGSGKSTLADLLPRFYDVQEGRILIDGKDIREVTLSSLRRQIGYVAQEGVLFHDTIENNIAYGDLSPNFAQIQHAANVAHASEFIDQLPEGYKTLTGERGWMLSGGQRQRISIARAVYRNPPILILDEATSNLDTESEKYVQLALEELLTDRTSIVIAHRLSTIVHADKILVLQKGEVVAQGTHTELLQNNPLYKKLYEVQFQGE